MGMYLQRHSDAEVSNGVADNLCMWCSYYLPRFMALWPFIVMPLPVGTIAIVGTTPLAVWCVVHEELVWFPYHMTFGVNGDLG